MESQEKKERRPKGRPAEILSERGLDPVLLGYRTMKNDEFSEAFGCSKSGMKPYIQNYLDNDNPDESKKLEKIYDRTLTFNSSSKGKRTIAVSDETYASMQELADELAEEVGCQKRYCVDYIIRKGIEACREATK